MLNTYVAVHRLMKESWKPYHEFFQAMANKGSYLETDMTIQCRDIPTPAWTEHNAPWDQIKDRVGIEVETANGRHLLVGHVNALGGECDDCPVVCPGDIIVRYRRFAHSGSTRGSK